MIRNKIVCASIAGLIGFGGAAVATEADLPPNAKPGESLEAEIRGRVIVNAAGPWVDAIRALEAPSRDIRQETLLPIC